MPTSHIAAEIDEVAKTVIMPGDPLRAKFIAETYLSDARLITSIRGIFGYTGYYNDTRLTVMASGMGIPSIGIYSYELYNVYNVESIIRAGSAGAFSDSLRLMDIVAGAGACTDSNFAHQFGLNGTFAPIADFDLLRLCYDAAAKRGTPLKVGNLLSTDNFYSPENSDGNDPWRDMNILAVEMESAGLYMNAARAGKRALCVCTISDHLYRKEYLSVEARQLSFNAMIELVLDTAVLAENL